MSIQDWAPRLIDSEAELDDLVSEASRRGWAPLGDYFVPSEILAAARVELGLDSGAETKALERCVCKKLRCEDYELPYIFQNDDPDVLPPYQWIANCVIESPLRADFAKLVGHLYACGLSIGSDDDLFMSEIQNVNVDGSDKIYSMTAIDSACALMEEIGRRLNKYYSCEVVKDLVGSDHYIWPTIVVSEPQRWCYGVQEVGAILVTEHPSREVIGDVVTAYNICHIKGSHVERAVRTAAKKLGIMPLDDVDEFERYRKAPMPAWYVCDHCDMM